MTTQIAETFTSKFDAWHLGIVPMLGEYAADFSRAALVSALVDYTDGAFIVRDPAEIGYDLHDATWVELAKRDLPDADPDEVQELFDACDEVPGQAVYLYVTDLQGATDEPRTLQDAYAGEYDTFRDYADELAEDLHPEAVESGYFDWSEFEDDLRHDCYVIGHEDSGVFVFHAI